MKKRYIKSSTPAEKYTRNYRDPEKIFALVLFNIKIGEKAPDSIF